MEKSILVMETPTCCTECLCHEFWSEDDTYTCEVADRIIFDVKPENEKPNWCPLKKLPEKKDEEEAYTDSAYFSASGWNDCIDTILEGGRANE